jgi:two-component system response regulator NreC
MGADSTEGPLGSLTPREIEVLRLLALGHTNVEIAEILGIAPRTVEAHREHVLQKLGARTRAQLVRIALDSGLLESGGS